MSGNLKKLDQSFYDRKNVVQIARELLGKILVTQWDGVRCSGRIVETEAYAGVEDRACHAFGGRKYVMMCYRCLPWWQPPNQAKRPG